MLVRQCGAGVFLLYSCRSHKGPTGGIQAFFNLAGNSAVVVHDREMSCTIVGRIRGAFVLLLSAGGTCDPVLSVLPHSDIVILVTVYKNTGTKQRGGVEVIRCNSCCFDGPEATVYTCNNV